MSKTATILAIRAADVPVGGQEVRSFPATFNPDVWAGPRPKLEEDPTFRQIIPFVLIKTKNGYLTYTRGKAGGEGRLHDLVSIGVGGHVDAVDAHYNPDGSISMLGSALNAAQREIQEEVGLGLQSYELRVRGLIVSNRSEVDKVHLGVVLEFDAQGWLDQGFKFQFEDTLETPRFMTAVDLMEANIRGELELESWTELSLGLL